MTSQGNHPDHPPIEGGYKGHTLSDPEEGWTEEKGHHSDTYFRWGKNTFVEPFEAPGSKVKGILIDQQTECLFIPYSVIAKIALLDKYVLLTPEEAAKLGFE